MDISLGIDDDWGGSHERSGAQREFTLENLVPGSHVLHVWMRGNGTMDDLTGDSRVDRNDAERLKTMALEVERASPELVGGVASYPATAAHGPFVHLDVRGKRASW